MKKQKNNQSQNNTPPTPIVEAKINLWLPTLLLGIFAFLLYANTLQHGYALDDYSVIKDNYITKKGLAGIGELLTTEYRKGYWNAAGTLYRPLSLVMFAAEWEFSPDKPFLSHLVNVLLFAITAMVAFRLLSKMLKDFPLWVAFISTALFVAHPIHTEVVANIKSRDEILALLFSLLTLRYIWKYLDNKSIFSLILALLCYGIAMFSKESAITFLAIFPLAIYFFKKEVSFSSNLKISALMLLPVIISMFMRAQVLGAQVGIDSVSPLDSVIAAHSGINKLAAAICMAGFYLKVLILPHPLVSDLGFNQVQINGFGDWKVLISALLYLSILAFAILKLKEKNIIAFGILFMLITFSISSNIFVTIGTGYGERLMYAPSLGFIIAIVGALYYFLDKKNINTNSFLPENNKIKYAALAVLAIFSIETFARNPAWKDSFTLYDTDINTAPNCAKLNYHYALELTKKGRDNKDNVMIDKAIQYFKHALELYPQYGDAYGEMGLAYFYKGDQDQALANYTKASELQPDAKVWSNMGMIFFNKGNLPEAQRVYEKSVALDPRFVDARRNLGSTYAMQGRFKDAIVQFQEAIKYAPDQAVLY